MNASETETLVRDAMSLIGAPPPEMLTDGAPVLSQSTVSGAEQALYLIGLIGGKEVGKSALVNALVGSSITAQTSTARHRDRRCLRSPSGAAELKDLLQRQVPGKYRIVTHQNPRLARQVLLDLPDIDSRFEEHIEITRRMLRSMLFPIWMQSVEKYADARPQALLQKVAAGNSPENFLFCLNKVDQLPPGDEAIELRDDYAGRIQSR